MNVDTWKNLFCLNIKRRDIQLKPSTDEDTFILDGINNAHNSHGWPYEDRGVYVEKYFLDRFSVNVSVIV